MAKVLVTGAAGFIGSHLVEALANAGAEVRAFVHYNALGSRGWLDHIPRSVGDAIEVHAGDIRDAGSVATALRGCATVYHLAALIGIPYSYEAPASYIDTNVIGTLNVVQAARDQAVDRVVHTSTSEVYGTAATVPITEDHRLHPQSPYAASKEAADQLALSYHRSFATPVAVVRPFNTYGPRQSARAVIPTIITQLAAGGPVRLGAVSPTRDFNYVADTVAGFRAAARADAAVGEVTNLGANYEISVADTAALIAEIMCRPLDLQTDEQRLRPDTSEVERLWCDNSRALERLDWTPAYAGNDGLRRGLEHTVAWFSDPANLALYRPGQYAV